MRGEIGSYFIKVRWWEKGWPWCVCPGFDGAFGHAASWGVRGEFRACQVTSRSVPRLII